jgi:hypothetical protein
MGADATLVKGAGLAAGGGIEDYGLAAAKGLTGISTKLGEATGEAIQERHDRFQKYADWYLAGKKGTVPHREYEQLEDDLRKRRNQFIWGGKTDRAMLIRELDEEQVERENIEKVKKKTAESAKDDVNGVGANPAWTSSTQGQSLVNALQNPPVWREDEGGNKRLFYPITNNDGEREYLTYDQISNLIDENSADPETRSVIDASVENAAEEGKQAGVSDAELGFDSVYNYEFNYRKNKNIVNKGNLNALTNIEGAIVPGRTFRTDVESWLMENDYQALGLVGIGNDPISKKRMKDPTPGDGKITEADAKIITDKLLKNKFLSKRYVTSYMTNYTEQNWIKAKNQARDSRSNTRGKGSAASEDFDKAFAKHRQNMIDQHGEDYDSWTNFTFRGEEFNPYTTEDNINRESSTGVGERDYSNITIAGNNMQTLIDNAKTPAGKKKKYTIVKEGKASKVNWEEYTKWLIKTYGNVGSQI